MKWLTVKLLLDKSDASIYTISCETLCAILNLVLFQSTDIVLSEKVITFDLQQK